MKSALLRPMSAAALLAGCLMLGLRSLSPPEQTVAAADSDAPADAPADEDMWTLVYRLSTKPGGETYAAGNMTHSPAIYQVAFWKDEFTVKPDGTFAWKLRQSGGFNCEWLAKDAVVLAKQTLDAEAIARVNGKVSGDKLELELEWTSGTGGGHFTSSDTALGPCNCTTTQTVNEDATHVEHDYQGNCPSHLSGPHGWFKKSKFELQPVAPEPPATGAAGERRGGASRIVLVSHAPPAGDAGATKTTKYRAVRETTLTVSPGTTIPVTESLKVTRTRKEKADLAVFFQGIVDFDGKPGSTGTIKINVFNLGSSDTTAHLTLEGFAGADFDPLVSTGGHEPVGGGKVKILSYSPDYSPKLTTNTQTGGREPFSLEYDIPLSSGSQKSVEIKVQDATPPNQKFPYAIGLAARVKGPLFDPDHGNNFDCKNVHIRLSTGK